MNIFEFKLYGEPCKVYFYTDKYANNDSTFVGAICIDENGEEDYYGNVSINVPFGYLENDNEFYADTNNSSEIVKAMLKEKLIRKTGDTTSSGYCIYPKVKLTKKFWEYVKENENEKV